MRAQELGWQDMRSTGTIVEFKNESKRNPTEGSGENIVGTGLEPLARVLSLARHL